MADYKIHVPRLDWLIGGSRIGGTYNQYFGSCGTGGKDGCLKAKIFNYSVWIEKADDEEETIKSCVYYGMNSFDNTAEEDKETKTFPLEEESREAIAKWLDEKARRFLTDGKEF